MPNDSSHLRILAVAFAITFSLSCVSTAMAQSGRRVQKSTLAPAPLPEASPAPAAKPEPPKPTLKLVLGMERYDSFTSISWNTYSGVTNPRTSGVDGDYSFNEAARAAADKILAALQMHIPSRTF